MGRYNIEDLKLIAKFMNVPKNGVNYHCSWDWLMPVVEKINTIDNFKYCFEIKHCFCRVTQARCIAKDYQILSTQGNGNFQATYKAVVKFIKWHNKKDK